MRRIIQLAGYSLSAIGVLLLILWAIRGAQPAIACGIIDALTTADWPAAYTCLDRSDYDPLIALFAMLGGALLTLAARLAPDATRSGVYNPTPEERKNNRAELIRRVRRIWITGYLDQSLYQEVLLYLGMQWNPADPPPNPFGMTALRLDGKTTAHQPADIALTVGAPLAAFYANVDHRLLILGAPGAGKTTVMLDLVRTFLDKAEQDSSIPTPVVFMLSSWPGPATPFEDWLVSEIRTRYGGDIREDVARYWLTHNEIALFFDGLDELPEDRRAAAIAAIETQQTLGSWFVVCSRATEYADLDARKVAFTNLDVVAIQPLKLYQIQGYLGELRSEQAARISAAIGADTTLQEVAETPLMLNVMLLASEVIDWTRLGSAHDPGLLRASIYNAYIQVMLQRKRAGTHDAPAKTLYWLRWLAQMMREHNQMLFLLEQMNRSWISQQWQKHIWQATAGLIAGMSLGLAAGLSLGLVLGTIAWLSYGIIAGVSTALVSVVVGGLIIGIIMTLFLGHLGGFRKIRVREKLRFSIVGLQSVLLVGLLLGTVIWVFNRWIPLLTSLFLGLGVSYVLGLFGQNGIIQQSMILESPARKTKPNHGIYQSVRNGAIVGLISLISTGVFTVLVGIAFQAPDEILLVMGLSAGVVFGIISGLDYGWEAVIWHFTLRVVLTLDGSMPLRYVRFLDACADRILLRKVGGGYMFIHRTFQEHIAALTPERIAEMAQRVEA